MFYYCCFLLFCLTIWQSFDFCFSLPLLLAYQPEEMNWPSLQAKDLTTYPNHRPQPMNWYTIESLAVSHSKQNKQPDSQLRVLPTDRISVHHCPSTGVRPLVIWAISSCGTPAIVPGLSEPASMVLLRSFLQSVSYEGEKRPSYRLLCAVYRHHLKADSCPTPAPF